MQKRIIVIVGIHGSGKTTLGFSLQTKGFRYYPEIGTELRKIYPENVMQKQVEFDMAVMKKELERDNAIYNDRHVAAIETWHIGNIAFAEARDSTDVATRYKKKLYTQLEKFHPCVIKLSISDSEFRQRASEKDITKEDALSFYRKVESNLNRLLYALDSRRLITILTDQYKDIKTLTDGAYCYIQENGLHIAKRGEI